LSETWAVNTSASFDIDPYPGKPKVLFIGFAQSTHTHAWIDLLDQSELNVRLFALPKGVPPEHWKVRTYVTARTMLKPDPAFRKSLYPATPIRERDKMLGILLRRLGYAARFKSDLEEGDWLFRILRQWRPHIVHTLGLSAQDLEERWLAQIIRQWRPDVIHTLGLEPASYFYLNVRDRFGLQGIGKWVVQARGGPDLTLHRLLPKYSDRIANVLAQCDQFIADNRQNYDYALEMGLARHKVSPLGAVPGTGGIDVEGLARAWKGLPSQRQRLVLWPKAYECPASKALPVLEAMRLAWDRIQPCEFYLTVVIQDEIYIWYQTFPKELRQHCHLLNHIPREEFFQLLVKSRVLLAPSLSDGVPNTLYEAMAAGAFPIFSPLETIMPIVVHERNVLFARNLYPQEIAEALCRAMTDDALVDSAARRNLELVGRIADRAKIGPRVVEYYKALATTRREW